MSEDNKRERSLLEVRKIFDEAGLPFVLHTSTALGVYRDQKLLGLAEVAFLAEDFYGDVEKKVLANPQCKIGTNKQKEKYCMLYMDIAAANGNRLECHAMYKNDKWAYQNLIEDRCLIWPVEMFKRENWGKIEFMGYEWNIPGDIENYLAFYFGPDWKTPDNSWNWHNAKSIRTWGEFEKW